MARDIALTVGQAADLSGIPGSTLRRAFDNGEIKGKWHGKHRRIWLSSIQAYIQAQSNSAATSEEVNRGE